MTHRSDRDWHGWDLQRVTEQVAQKRYAAMRERWPASVQAQTPELLADVPNHNPIGRQIKEAVLPAVVDVLDVITDMPHPVLSELQSVLIGLDARLADLSWTSAGGAVAQVDALAEIRSIVARYTEGASA